MALLQRLGAGPSANDMVTVAPASLAAAFSFLDWGADSGMRNAMAKVLGFDASTSARAVFEALRAARASWDKDESKMIHTADRLVLDPAAERYPITDAGLANRGAEVLVDDLSKAEAIGRVNDWAKAATQGRVPQILDGPLDRAAFVALNALHFKGNWQTRFDPAQTKPAPFTSADGKPTEAAMMHLAAGRYAFRTDSDFVGIDLPFDGERFSLIIVTTKEKPAQLAAFDQVATWLGGKGFSVQRGELTLPRMSITGNHQLLSVLDSMGLADGRRSPTALGGFAIGAQLSRIVQHTALEVNEDGAEAAAVTAVITERGFSDEPKIAMRVDKPFVYALRDRQTGLLVLAGYVGRAPADKGS